MGGATSPKLEDRKLDSVQLLRAIAASMVVIGHLIGAAVHHPELSPSRPYFAGGAGVDVFFLISGFIMVHASQRLFGSVAGARDFLIRRLIRIIPLYWLVTAIVLILLIVSSKSLPPISAIFSSLLFIPFDSTARGDGFAFPIVDLGWTLNYEMMFYLIFAIFLPLGRDRCVAAVLAILFSLVVIGSLAAPEAVAVRFWTRPIILEFGVGMAIALMNLRGLVNFSSTIRVMLIVAAATIYLFDPFGLFTAPITPNGFERLGSWGVASALLLIATISGPVPLGNAGGKIAVRLGDASYALYLLHPFVIIVMNRTADLGLFTGTPGAIIFVTAGFATAAIGSIIFHHVVERPATAGLKHALQRIGVPAGSVPLPKSEPQLATIDAAGEVHHSDFGRHTQAQRQSTRANT